eukprot:CAMPEP_0194332606 /NCGR_PEP_ID=MMETSP0171-20130528/59692_1 /TAXON_ID=218684 /ORGANISM="Corethron pennatum, Strain L29A3" /LENGTH=223 /DNA_ID=CAMNT_0039094529 /DNA_START=14 /DNA_END=685 /DNA_ORIENTATION=-
MMMGNMAGGMNGGNMGSFASTGGMPNNMASFSSARGMPSGMGPFGIPGFGGMSSQPQPQAPACNVIPGGTLVSLVGLVNAADRNGDRGVVQGLKAGRYVVQLEDSDETMSVKPSNLLQHIHVTLHGIASQPSLNGREGTVVAWSSLKERYSVYVAAMKKIINVKAQNVVLPNGTVAKVTGVASKPEFNEKWGTIINFVKEIGKYDVKLSEKQIIRIKLENVLV